MHNVEYICGLYEDNPYIRIAPYTGYYQFRRKYESQTDQVGYSASSQGTQYYSWSIVRNRLRGVYPTGGRMGMCVVLEKTRASRFLPYGVYTWPYYNMSDYPTWGFPLMLSNGRVDYIGVADQAAQASQAVSSSLVLAWTVGQSSVNTINDTHPPAGFCTDLRGILTYIRNSDIPIQTIDLDLIPAQPDMSRYTGAAPVASTRCRYDIAPVDLWPPISDDLNASAQSALSEITPVGIFWPLDIDPLASSANLDKNKVLSAVETWKEINLFPVAYDDRTYETAYVANYPTDYTEEPSTNGSALYLSTPGSIDHIAQQFDGFVYWVTRDGPIDRVNTIALPDGTNERIVDRRVICLLFEVDLNSLIDNVDSRYRSTGNTLFGSNSISPRDIKSEPEGLLEPHGLPLGGRYNQVFTEFGMNSAGAPADSSAAWSIHSEILHHYDLSGVVMSGNVVIDSDIVSRSMTAGQVHHFAWSELGRVFRYSDTSTMPSGGSLSLIGAMATMSTMSILGQGSQFTNDRFAVYLGGISYSVLQNNTMPEMGVAIGSHRGNHTIHLLECGADLSNTTEDEDIDDDSPATDGAPPNLNRMLELPKVIFQYNGFGASPHKLTFLDNGIILIPTDIGILQYDYINNDIMGEWLNPTLIPSIRDGIYIDGGDKLNILYHSIPSMVNIEVDGQMMSYPEPSLSVHTQKDGIPHILSDQDTLCVDAEYVYEKASHIGSYGQVTFHSADFSGDLIIKLVR